MGKFWESNFTDEKMRVRIEVSNFQDGERLVSL